MTTHMLVVSAITHTADEAGKLARSHGIEVGGIYAHDQYMFIARPKREFVDGSLTKIPGMGHYVLKGNLL